MTQAMKPVELSVIDTNTAAWELFPVEYIKANLEHVPLVNDPETGMMVLKMVYRAGFTNPWHSHPCAHGVYVLEGPSTPTRASIGRAASCGSPRAGSWSMGRHRTRTDLPVHHEQGVRDPLRRGRERPGGSEGLRTLRPSVRALSYGSGEIP